MEFKYKIEKKFEVRKEEYQKIIEERPGRIGVLWEKLLKVKLQK